MAWESDPEDFSPAATIVPFDPPLPLLRGPVNAAPGDDPSAGSFVLAFRDAASWRSAYRATESKRGLPNCCGIEKIAWDASGERLALSFRDSEEMYRGLIAVYDIKRTPLISPSLVGFIRGPGEYPKPLAFSFHSKFKQGPLLSVCWSSGLCCTYPLIFRSHILP